MIDSRLACLRHIPRLVATATVVLCTFVSSASAQVPVPPDLSQLSIEDLLNVEITTAARKPQRVADIPAAVFVISSEDIRRSGMTTLPELLRLAPGVDVARINSNKWAVSVRGFNGQFANKLLVLVDGRSVYTQLFSGVLWDMLDLMLDDIDRIEVIRGPGAAVWGANAVNGVINIVTRTAADTQGGLVRIEGGVFGAQAAIRYGGTRGAITYRFFAQGTAAGETRLATGADAADASRRVTAGFRADWSSRPGAFTFEGAIKTGTAHALWASLDPQAAARDPIVRDASHARGGHLLGRWTRKRAGGASMQIQSYLDLISRQESVGDYDRHAFDVDAQYRTPVGSRQDVVAGAGYRFERESLAGRNGASLTPAENDTSRITAFIQDEIALAANRVLITLGTHVQYSAGPGTGVQPTARVMWKAGPGQRLWAATSRALRTPSLGERGIRFAFPPVPTGGGLPLVVTVQGNPAARTEEFADAEVGYRHEIGPDASIDVTGFLGHYQELQTFEPEAPILEPGPPPRIVVASRFGNQLAATTRGLEIAAHWTPVSAWRLDASYTTLQITPRLAATSRDPRAADEDGSVPRTEWQLRSTFRPVPRATLNVAIFHVGRLEQLGVEAYTRADINAEWRATPRLSVKVSARNLFDTAHAEFSGADSLVLATQIPRSVSVGVRWTF